MPLELIIEPPKHFFQAVLFFQVAYALYTGATNDASRIRNELIGITVVLSVDFCISMINKFAVTDTNVQHIVDLWVNLLCTISIFLGSLLFPLILVLKNNKKSNAVFKSKEDLKQNKKSSFDHYMEHPQALQVFKEYLVTELALENLLFMQQIREYQSANDPKKAGNIIKEVQASFINANSEYEINITSGTRKRLLEKVKTGSIDKDLFDEAAKEVVQMLKSDVFPRFVKSSLYIKYAEA